MISSDKQDFSTMQQDAIRRVREMQKKSQNMVKQTSNEQSDIKNSNFDNQPHNNNILSNIIDNFKNKKHNDELFNIAGVSIDEEKALIILLIYILFKQGTENKLLLALGYLLL